MLLKQLLKNLDYTLVQGCLNTEVTDIYYCLLYTSDAADEL